MKNHTIFNDDNDDDNDNGKKLNKKTICLLTFSHLSIFGLGFYIHFMIEHH